MRTRSAVAAFIGATAAGAVGCAPGSGELVVSAAASLTDVLADLEDRFEAANPGVEVTVNVAGSQTLVRQVEDGAPVGVLAVADPALLERVETAGPTTVFAGNTLAIAVPPGNPRRVRALADLADPSLRLVLPAPEVPAGRYARVALDRAGVTVAPDSLEVDVRAVLAKVALGEADAGIVYASDVATADVEGIAVPGVVARYAVARLPHGDDTAAAFVDLLLSDVGAATLRAHGLLPP